MLTLIKIIIGADAFYNVTRRSCFRMLCDLSIGDSSDQKTSADIWVTVVRRIVVVSSSNLSMVLLLADRYIRHIGYNPLLIVS